MRGRSRHRALSLSWLYSESDRTCKSVGCVIVSLKVLGKNGCVVVPHKAGMFASLVTHKLVFIKKGLLST